MIERLHETIAAVCPIEGVNLNTKTTPYTVRIDYAASATPEQRAAADSALAAFDWTQAAQDEWEANQNPERKTLREQAISAVQGNNDYLTIASPTQAQALGQVRRLTQQANAIIKRLIQID